MPRRVIGRCFGNDILVRLHEVIPQRAISEVIGVELPMLVRIFQTRLEPAFLFLLRDVQKNLHDRRALFRKHAFEIDDVPRAALPNLVGKNLFHAHRDHIFVVTAVEDHQLPTPRHLRVDAPQEIMREFLFGRFLERSHMNALRIDVRKNMLDAAILAAGVHRLHDHQDPMLVLRVEQLLLLLELLLQFAKLRLVVILAIAGKEQLIIGLDLAEMNLAPGLDPVVFQCSGDWHGRSYAQHPPL